jgi:hypothetical protein
VPLAESFQARIGRLFDEEMHDCGYLPHGIEIKTVSSEEAKQIHAQLYPVFLIRWIDPGTDTKGSLRPESVDPMSTDEDGANDIMAIQQKLYPERIYWVVKNPENESRIIKP